MKKKVVILADIIKKKRGIRKDSLDTLTQVIEIENALKKIGYSTKRLEFSLDLNILERRIKKNSPKFVFNLVEDEQNILFSTLFLEKSSIKFTGAKSQNIFLTTNKLLMKDLILSSNSGDVKTAIYISKNKKEFVFRGEKSFIIKPVSHHASINISEESVIVAKNFLDVLKKIESLEEKYKMHFFAEEFIDGREFNVAILNREILPIQEIIFKNYPKNKPKIVCYKAKWDEESFEYKNTPRKFIFEKKDKDIFDRLKKSAVLCMDLFGLDSYARIDFRVDTNGVPYVIDINANPCLSSDAGFFAACKEVGMSYEDMIRKIVRE